MLIPVSCEDLNTATANTMAVNTDPTNELRYGEVRIGSKFSLVTVAGTRWMLGGFRCPC